MRVVGPVGDDFGEAEYDVLRRHGVNTDDIEHVEGGKTFFWAGEYEWDLNTAHTLDTQLNVFGEFEPKLSERSRDCDVLFLANIQPDLQRDVREQCGSVQVAALDSMNFWIETTRDSLVRTIGVVDMVLMNDDELRMLTEEPNLVRRPPPWSWARAWWWSSRASTAPRCSPRTASSRCPPIRSRTCSTPPAPATPSPAASSATSTRRAARPTTRRCAAR